MKERWRRGPPCGCGLGSANGTPAPWPFRLLASRWSCFRALFDMAREALLGAMASQADEEAGALSLVTWASVGRVAARRCLETLGGERWRSQLCRMTRAESQHDLCAADTLRPSAPLDVTH